ncbi:DNA polymerase III subunit theta [Enterobacter hormaechei]|uniref:DNA polymerase III subunit theta n=1 Tax=Enterobacter cloacae complex TaxID=354276 RepID=UPI00075041F4|nr:DNA polymerase III subunit theta [Enterobacter hormaechei]MBT1880535.1 DNA polymerase III subunit theta [Enterobacter hormaechei subsp. xiangfangensis]MVX96261.1 DNA polymerase III subunit theta [Enterobacteriaceae bacterium 8376wB9]MWT61346.1 DNA polymerase III subunit theta [Escherichia coli]EHF4939455.1 DNA polymerase III subunit theta [Enterobacter hormaechei]EHF5006681.1 DNA polymerase III subunit theta [Enterobacter hormaechei]
MSKFNIAVTCQEDRDKVNVVLAASGVVYRERLNMPVIAEVVMREQPHEYQEFLLERLYHYRELSLQLPKVSDPRYVEMAEKSSKI